MSNHESHNTGPKKLGSIKRKAISMSQTELVKIEQLDASRPLPLLMEPAVSGVDLITWADDNRSLIEKHLLKHGGILFRNFVVPDVAAFERFVKAVSGQLLEYRERSSPRSQVSENIYTSTDYPPDQSIFLHNENSYQHTWPQKIAFYCAVAAQRGGETPIADVRNVFNRIDPAIRARFAEKGWMYVRNFSDGIGLSWQTVFQTDDPADVNAYCANHGIQTEWRDGNRLRTRAVRPAIAQHPRTGENLWFNHATFFHVSTLSPAVRDSLLAEFDQDELPANTYYGDGTPIEPPVLDALRTAYQQETVAFPWRVGDILLLDNMLVAHARAPFEGPRKVLVGMAEPISRDDLEQPLQQRTAEQ